MKKKLITYSFIFSLSLFGFQVFDPDLRIIPKKDFCYKSVKHIYYYRYFIEARYGKKFTEKKIREEFEKELWYKINPNYSKKLLNEIDRINIKNLEKLYKSLIGRINQLRKMKEILTWEKKVNFIGDNIKEKLIFKITKKKNSFKIHYQIFNKDKIYYQKNYELFNKDFKKTDLPNAKFEGIYEVIAMNFEFINIEFYPNERMKMFIATWLVDKKGLPKNEADKLAKQVFKDLNNFKGEVFFPGFKDNTCLPPEFIYLQEVKDFVLIDSH